MKKMFSILLILTVSNYLLAQENAIAKSCFYQAKAELENMLSGKTKPEYEKAIFIIENAWYENRIDENEYKIALQSNVDAIQELIKSNYKLSDIKQKPNYLFTQKQLEERYKKALTNWAIYTFMSRNTFFVDRNSASIHHSYHYSNSDPMGTNDWRNTQVINLNNTKYGNCFALASMFKILSDRLHSEASLCTAPSHIYIRHLDEKGVKYNVELGTQNFPGTGVISTITYSTDEAIQNNISQRELNDKQAIALCLVYLAKGYEYKFNNTSDIFILQCAETALQYDNKNLNALLLKAEYLENKFITQQKNISVLQKDREFQNYQALITDLYNLGYREMPLEMKNLIIRSSQNDSTLRVSAPVNPITSKGRYATISWGMFDERHEYKTIERIGNTLFNTKTKKITSFAKSEKLYNNYSFDPAVFAWNIDPLFKKYPAISPYAFCSNSPIVFFDPDGREQWICHNKGKNRDGTANIELVQYKGGKLYNTSGAEVTTTSPFINMVKTSIDNNKLSDPRVAQVFNDLENTTNKHLITNEDVLYERKGTSNRYAKDGKYLTVTVFKPDEDREEPELATADNDVLLGHDTKHAWNKEKGIRKTTTTDGVRDEESDAVNFENIIRDSKGVPLREKYNNIKIPDSKKVNPADYELER